MRMPIFRSQEFRSSPAAEDDVSWLAAVLDRASNGRPFGWKSLNLFLF
jgi:hypothetical protein